MTHVFADAVVNCLGQAQCDTGLPTVGANSSNLHVALQLIFGIAGAVAVIVIILAGLRLQFSQGNPQEAATARQTIIYAIAGLLVALSAEGIVTFVLTGI
ncbi:MAG TPA: pilin [Candidatus Saccharimonadales bacterium]|nr:pilin [Candidatus Saccharimonadales bacterium]